MLLPLLHRVTRTEHRRSLEASCRRRKESPDRVAAVKKSAACRRRRENSTRETRSSTSEIQRRRHVAGVATIDSDTPRPLLYGARTVSDGSPSARMIVVVSMLTSRSADSLPRAANSDSQTAFAVHGRIDLLESLLDLLSFVHRL